MVYMRETINKRHTEKLNAQDFDVAGDGNIANAVRLGGTVENRESVHGN